MQTLEITDPLSARFIHDVTVIIIIIIIIINPLKPGRLKEKMESGSKKKTI